MRTFIALEVPARLSEQLGGVAMELSGHLRGRFLTRDTYHVTLAFLGDIEPLELDAVKAALDEATADCGPIELEPDGLGTFGRPINSTLWVGMAEHQALMALAARVREGLACRGIAFDDKEFVPHVTLARRARVLCDALPHLKLPAAAASTRVVVMESVLGEKGARYSELYAVDLA